MAFTNWKSVLNCGGCLAQRYVLAVMLLVGVVNLFTMRVCLNVAIVQMASAPVHNQTSVDHTCPPPRSSGNASVVAKPHEFEWTEEEQSYVLSAFYWGYVISHVPGGLVADRFGGKYTMMVGCLSTAVTTLLSPYAATAHDWPGLVVLRVIMGLGEGVTFPALSVMLAKWAPPNERSRIGSFVFAGAQLGTVIGTALSGVLLQAFSWEYTFYFFGGMGALWCVWWQLLCYSTPEDHPFISDKEHKYLSELIKPDRAPAAVPWGKILMSVPIWAIIVGQIGHDWGFFTMVTDLPKYMNNVLHYSIATNGMLSALPYLVMWVCSNLFGFLADWVITTNRCSILTVRKFLTLVASVVPAAGILGASYAGCDHTLVVTLFTIGMAGMGGFYPGMRVNALDLTKNYAGTVMALVNGIGALSGIISPIIIGVLTPNSTLLEWRTVFIITFVFLVVTGIIYAIFAQASVQPWDIQESEAKDLATYPNGGRVTMINDTAKI